jgi:hypothetical protein
MWLSMGTWGASTFRTNMWHQFKKKKDSLVFYETCYYNKSDDDISIINFDVPNDNEEYVLSMPCENDILDDHDDTLSSTTGILCYADGQLPSA